MSLLVCLLGTDGLVLATDSRGTFGDPRGVTAQNDRIKKLYLTDGRVGVMVAGAGDLGSTVVSSFLALPNTASLGITELTMALHVYVRAQFRQWFELFAIKATVGDPRPSRPDLDFIVAGFELNDEPKIYRLSSSLDFAPMLHNYGFGIDGVAQYALYLLNRLYDRESIVEDLQYLAAYVITETASQDGKVGGPVQMATIAAGRSHLLGADALENILVTNRERSRALKTSFLQKDDRRDSEPRKNEPEPRLNTRSEAEHANSPVVIPLHEFAAAMDASSRVPNDEPERFSAGTIW
jgi:20S proteasome alpha/beta subunit